MLLTIWSGIEATVEIRQIEASRQVLYDQNPASLARRPDPTKILALTGMSSLDDKRRAFEAGVDG